ncbi:hypothetical protein Gpo141_00011325 [Globisporangium polare]
MEHSVLSDGGGGNGDGTQTTLLTGLQALTRRLQDERNALQRELDDATRALQSERSAKTSLENALQVRELELLHVTQKQQQTSAQLRERASQLERELEEERAQHKVTLMARNAAAQKSAALAAEVKQVEVKWRKEMEKKELALAEVEILRDDALGIALDRDQLVERTEADAKRVRELWQQIAREHESKLDALRQELETTKQANASVERIVAQYETRSQETEEKIKMLTEQNVALEQRVASTTQDQSAHREFVEVERSRDRERDEKAHQLSMQLQELRSECKLSKQREEMAVREQKLATGVLSKCQKELEAKTEELLVLKSEFSNLLDRHEQLEVEYKLRSRQRLAEVELRSQKLARGKRCAEELAALRQQEIAGYKQVISSVNRKLNDVRESHEALDANAWVLTPGKNDDVRQKSLCIYRH